MALDWQTLNLPLVAGLQTRADERALRPPALQLADDVQFDEVGGLQTRLPYSQLVGTSSNVRRVVPYGDELLVFTDDELQSYSALDGDLTSRATYLAPVVTERARFTRTEEQTLCDRAELGGVVVYAWLEDAEVRLAAIEKATGSVLLPVTSMGSFTTRPRLVALTTRILLFCDTGSVLSAKALDVSSRANLASTAGAVFNTISTALFIDHYDVVALTSTIAAVAYRDNANQMVLRQVNQSAAAISTNATGRAVTGPIALAVAPTGGAAVVRVSGTNLIADLLTSSLTDGVTGTTIGSGTTLVNQVAAAFKTTTDGGNYRCIVYWSSNETATADFLLETNWIATNAAIGTESTVINRCGVASRAFVYDGSRVMVWAAYAQSSTSNAARLQNTYFLLDAEGTIHGRAVPAVGGGYSPARGHLPNVQAISATTFACALAERRVVPLGAEAREQGYAQRSPVDVQLSLDDDGARRAVQIGETLYITGAQIMQYDGVDLLELGFPVYPGDLSVVDSGVAGALAAGTYAWRATLRRENAKGEIERSTSATIFDQAIAASRKASVSVAPVHQTNKRSSRAALEIWRTLADPVSDSPYYLTTSKDPTATGDNGYLENDPTASGYVSYTDNLGDTTLGRKESEPAPGDVLESLAPPGATVIAAGRERVFLGGLARDPYAVAYSKLRGQGELAAFHDGLVVQLPATGGAVVAIAVLNETPIVFTERAIYALSGGGLDNLGGGDNYTPTQIASDVGASSSDAVAVTPEGVLFHSRKGWHMLTRGLSVEYIGAPVSAYDDLVYTAVDLMPAQQQVRCLGRDAGGSESELLVFDYLVGQWARWPRAEYAPHAAVWGGRHVLLDEAALQQQDAAAGSSGYDYGLDVQTAWIKMSDLQGFGRLRRLLVLGEYRTAHDLRIRLAFDYDDSWIDDKVWTVSPATIGGPEQVELRPSRQKCQAVKVRITAQAVGSSSPPAGEALKLTGLALEVGIKRGTYKRLPAAQKQ